MSRNVGDILPEKARHNSSKTLLSVINEIPRKLGFIVAEQYDFGSARAINGLFSDLMTTTPFTKEEMNTYSEFLNERNLLVHHGGVFTVDYARQKMGPMEWTGYAHFQSLVVNKLDVGRYIKFLIAIATKIGVATRNRLLAFGEEHQMKFSEDKQAAINWLAFTELNFDNRLKSFLDATSQMI